MVYRNSSGRNSSSFLDPLTSDEADKLWLELKSAIDEIHNKNAGSLSYENLYRNAYTLVLYKYGDRLYDNIKLSLTHYLKKLALGLSLINDSRLLCEIVTVWTDYKTSLGMLADVFMYLDRNYSALQGRLPTFILGIELFRQEILEYVPVALRLMDEVLLEIRNDRMSGGMDRPLMKSLTTLLVEADPTISFYRSKRHLQIQDRESIVSDGEFYKRFFEIPFLHDTSKFYKAECADCIEKLTVLQYMEMADRRLGEEELRAQQAFYCTTVQPLKQRLISEYIIEHHSTLISHESQGCSFMFHHNSSQGLSDMYKLFSLAPHTLEGMASTMETTIIKNGDRIMNDVKGDTLPSSIIDDIIQLYYEYNHYVIDCFQEDFIFKKALKSGFEYFLNRDSKAAKYLALSVDEAIKSLAIRMANDQHGENVPTEFDLRLNSIIILFNFLADKDIFEGYCREALGRRLLLHKNTADELERLIVNRLTVECGPLYTAKMEGMLRDVKISKDLDQQFKNFRGAHAAVVDFTVSVLTSGRWAIDNSLRLTFPSNLLNECQAYEDYYYSLHTGRKLTWLSQLGMGELRGTFSTTCRRDLVLQTIPMLILLLFNDKTCLSFDEIARQLNIEAADELKRHLISLFGNPKLRILLWHPKESKPASEGSSNPARSMWAIDLDDTFEINCNFEPRSFKVKVPAIKMKLTTTMDNISGASGGGLVSASPPDNLPAGVEAERKALTDAAIIRVMKARKVLNHKDLLIEVTKLLQSRFIPKHTLIKAQIGHLIERDYLNRSGEDVNTYKYVA